MRLRYLFQLAPVFMRCLGRLPLGHLLYLTRHLQYEKPQKFDGQLRINSFFPPYPSEAFERFLAAVVARRRVPHSVYYAVTDKCPFNCPQCSYGNHVPGRLDTESAIAVIGQVKALGTAALGISGGEPLLRVDLPKLVAAAGPEMATVLFTTGFGLTPELAAELRAAGLGSIMISLESAEAAEHDRLRGYAGSFDSALRAIATANDAGLFTAVSVVAVRDKISSGQLEAIYELAEKLSVRELRVLEPLATGRLSGCGSEQLTDRETDMLRDFHKQKNRHKHGPAVCCFSQMESPELFGCGAGYHHLYIDAVGNVCPCDLTPLGLGNVTERPLAEIWSDMARYFDRPRCRCLMKELVDMPDFATEGVTLPLPQPQSEQLLQKLEPNQPLPGMYKRILK